MSGAIRKEEIEIDGNKTGNLNSNQEDDFEVEIIDDTPEPDRNRFVAPEETESDEDITVREEEIKDYKEAIQKRIKGLSAQTHAERRAKEQAVKERNEAIEFAKRVQEEYGKLRDYSTHNEAALVENAKRRTEVEIASLQREAKEAYDTGDSEKFIELQTKLQKAILENDKYSSYRPPQRQPQSNPNAGQAQPQGQPQQQTPPQPDPTALAWHDDNKWFMGEGEIESEMTAYAFAVSDTLIRKKGVDPRSKEYYAEISKSVRKRFPDYAAFKPSEPPSEPGSRTRSVVAPSSRSVGGNRKTVQLTPTQVRLASRLGLTVEQYAKQLLKEQQSQ